MATVIALDEVQATGKYEPGLRHRFGLTDETCGAKNLCMLRASIPPGNRIRAHFHLKAETCIFILSGRARVIMGAPGMQDETYEVGPNTFIYMDEGEMHNFINLSQEETVELVASYSAPNGEATRKIYIEPPVEQTPT